MEEFEKQGGINATVPLSGLNEDVIVTHRKNAVMMLEKLSEAVEAGEITAIVLGWCDSIGRPGSFEMGPGILAKGLAHFMVEGL